MHILPYPSPPPFLQSIKVERERGEDSSFSATKQLFELKSVVAVILPSVYKDNRTVFLAFLLCFF